MNEMVKGKPDQKPHKVERFRNGACNDLRSTLVVSRWSFPFGWLALLLTRQRQAEALRTAHDGSKLQTVPSHLEFRLCSPSRVAIS
jgi:hypothetical protein